MHTLSRQTECTSLLLPECSTYTPVYPCKRHRIIDWMAASPPHTALSTLQEYLHLHRTSLRHPHPPPPDIGGALCKHRDSRERSPPSRESQQLKQTAHHPCPFSRPSADWCSLLSSLGQMCTAASSFYQQPKFAMDKVVSLVATTEYLPPET